MRNDYPLREKMRKNQVVFGTWNTIASPLTTEAIATSGLDFIIIDMEHGPFSLESIHLYVDKCLLNSCAPIVRVPNNDNWMILQVLDQGAHGIIVPKVETATEATQIVSAVNYFPKGERGFSPFTKAGRFTNKHSEAYAKEANENIITAVIVETRKGLSNLDKILEVKGLDIVYFGAYDLSQAIGVPGDLKNDRLVKLIGDSIKKVRSLGKYVGSFVPLSVNETIAVMKMGANFLTYQVDTNVIRQSYQTMLKSVR